MNKALKTQGKNGQGHMMAHLAPPIAHPRQIAPTPAFAAARLASPARMGGGHPAPTSLPLSVTPFIKSGDLGVQK